MPNATVTDTSGARDALLDAAERLIAERGVDGVSVREIAVAAGSRNNSAVNYYFGDRTGLLHALFRRRMEGINDERQSRLEGLGDLDLCPSRDLVTAYVAPIVDALAPDGRSYYTRFMARALPAVDVESAELQTLAAPAFAIRRQLEARMTGPGVATRAYLALSMVMFTLAMHEEAAANGRSLAGESSLDDLTGHLVTMTVGALGLN